MKKKPPRLFALASLIWGLVTLGLGLVSSGRIALSSSPASPLWHPYWGVATLVPVLLLYVVENRRLGKMPPSRETRDAILRQYAAILGIATAALTGLGAMMGFLPPFFHQGVVWPLALFLISDGIRRLRTPRT